MNKNGQSEKVDRFCFVIKYVSLLLLVFLPTSTDENPQPLEPFERIEHLKPSSPNLKIGDNTNIGRRKSPTS